MSLFFCVLVLLLFFVVTSSVEDEFFARVASGDGTSLRVNFLQ